jgi:hypothetical protein
MKLFKWLMPISVILVSACGGIPTNSSIHQGESVIGGSDQFIRVIARPPSNNMEPEALVRGFLDACADSTSTFAIARQYLTTKASSSWNPATGIRIYDGNALTLQGADASVKLAAPLDSSVSASGHLTFSSRPGNVYANFDLVRDTGNQWRISNLDNGLLLSRSDFDRSFRPFSVYFLNDDSSALVPHPIMLPASSIGTATSVTRALLEGPPSSLVPSVHSAFPAGTKLSYSSVPITSGIAQVDLSAEVLAASKVERSELSAQLVATLSAIPGVTGVRISVLGQPLKVPGVNNVQTQADWERYSVRPNPDRVGTYVVRDSQLVRLEEKREVIVTSLATPALAPLGAAAVSVDGQSFAATTADGKSLLAASSLGDGLSRIAGGEYLSKPTWDRNGNIFVADNGHGILSYDRDGKRNLVIVDGTPIGEVKAIRHISIAHDGARVALTYRSGTADSLAVGIVVHEKRGIRITQIHRVERSIVTISDLAWAGPNSIEVLGGTTQTFKELLSVDISDGQVSSEVSPLGAQQIAVDGFGNILVGISDGSRDSIVKKAFGPWQAFALGRAPFTGMVTK